MVEDCLFNSFDTEVHVLHIKGARKYFTLHVDE
jgi:hypothetical protein